MEAIAYIDPKVHPHAKPFYEVAPQELVKDGDALVVTHRITVRDMTLVSLLTAMNRDRQADRAAVVVCHGTADALLLPLVRGAQRAADEEAIALLADDTVSAKEAGAALDISKTQVRDLRRLAKAVRRRSIPRIEFRACNLGANPALLEALRAWFGATAAGAPTELDVFGKLVLQDITSDLGDWRDWFTDPPNYPRPASSPDPVDWVQLLAVGGSSGTASASGISLMATKLNLPVAGFGRLFFGYWYVIDWATLRFQNGAMAESVEASDLFVETYLPGYSASGRPDKAGQRILIHGLMIPNAPLVFPGDPTYLGFLVSTT